MEATVTSAPHLRPKEPPKLRPTDFGEGHADWKHQTLHSIKFWNPEVAKLMTTKELSFTKWHEDDDDEFWIDPKNMDANLAGFQLLSAAVRKRARTRLNTAMSKAIKGPNVPAVHESSDDDDSGYPEEYKDFDGTERQARQKESLKTSVYVAWQALLEHDDGAADRIMQKLMSMKCYKIGLVPDHLDKINDLYEEYKATVEEQRLEFEQSMLSDHLMKSLPDSYYLAVSQAELPRQSS